MWAEHREYGGVVEERWNHEMLWERPGVAPIAMLTFECCGDLQNCWLGYGEDLWLAWLLLPGLGPGPGCVWVPCLLNPSSLGLTSARPVPPL